MAKLIYDNVEMGWRCSHCDGLFGNDEIFRAFNYDSFNKHCFNPFFCMDCGERIVDVDMRGFEKE